MHELEMKRFKEMCQEHDKDLDIKNEKDTKKKIANNERSLCVVCCENYTYAKNQICSEC